MSRDARLVFLALFLWGFGEGMFFYFQPLTLQQFGADPVHIGAYLSVAGIVTALAHLPAGYLADRFGRRPVMWLAFFLALGPIWIMALANSLTIFVIGLVAYGLNSMIMSPMNSYVTHARGRWSVGRAIMINSIGFNLGMIFGPLLGGQIAQHLGLHAIYSVSGWIVAAATTMILFIHPQPLEKHTSSEPRLRFLANPRLLYYLVAVFLGAFATTLPQQLTPNFLHNLRGVSLATLGMIISLTGLGTVTINLIFIHLNPKLGYLLAQLTVCSFAILIWKGTGLPWYALGYFLLGGYKTTRSLATTQMRSLVQASNMGTAYGVTEMVSSFSVILAPLAAGIIYAHSPSAVYVCTIGVTLLSLLAALRFCPAINIPEVQERSLPLQESEPIG